jgi:4-hydroxy-tetrahydrodipicolinate synthase
MGPALPVWRARIFRWELAMGARFTGLIPPTLTPLDSDERLDRPAVQRLVDFLIDGGVDGLFVLGSTGEAPTLRLSVRQALVEATAEAVGGRVPVIAGVLEPATARVIDDLRALSGRGLDAYVITAPYYFGGPTDAELESHFRRVAEAADLPILLYNIPQTTKVNLSADLVLRLSSHPNVAGIKDSSGNWHQVQQIILERTSPGFTVLQGNEAHSAITLLAGGDGLVPGHANIYPRLCADLIAATRRGEVAEAFRLQARFDALGRLEERVWLHGMKVVLKALGIMDDHVTLPLPRLSAEQAEQLLAANVAMGVQVPVGV